MKTSEQYQHSAPQDRRELDDVPIGCSIAEAQRSQVHEKDVTEVHATAAQVAHSKSSLKTSVEDG
jgi:hypothetical protein